MKTILSQNLKRLRKQKHLTQDQAADRIWILRSRLGAYEEARAAPPLEVLLKICSVYGVSDPIALQTVLGYPDAIETKKVKDDPLLVRQYNAATPMIKQAINILLGLIP